jgi:tRNA pseudouridine38-40 synthase
MPRYALLIDYDGGPFAGWQRQSHLPSVQGAIEAALSKLTPDDYVVTGAGRTDAGVHATGQVAHVDIAREWDTARLMGAINAHLRPLPVAVLQLARVADDFHARFSARERRYLFRLQGRRAPVTHDRGRRQVPHI